LITTGTLSPELIPGGTTTLTWYLPIVPGANAARVTEAGTPSIVAVTGRMIVLNGVSGVSVPGVTGGLTAPSPVQKIVIASPACAGFCESTNKLVV
jgi:hypothetical protein